MPRFNYGGLVTSGTGRFNAALGGLVLQKNGRFRVYVTPANPQTDDQIEVRGRFQILQAAWSGTLTDSQRLAWEAAASSGEWQFQDAFTGTSRNPTSGKELFTYVNINVMVVADDNAISNTTPPTKVDPGDTAIGTVTMAAGAGTASCPYTGTLGSNEEHVVSATNPLSPGTMKPRKSAMRVISPSQSGATPINFAAAYVAKYGTLTGTSGKAVFVLLEAINTNTGQRRVCGLQRVIIAA